MCLRIAWFSPMPPSTSGIAAYSAEVLPLLSERALHVEVFDQDNAHEFVWRHRRHPYHLIVYQLGNASCHDFMWGYLFRYPGVVVLHDAQLHQARALHLTKRWQPRRDDYLDEFEANHPGAPRDVGHLIAAGMGSGALYQIWPHVRLVIAYARLTLVHNVWVARDLRERFEGMPIEAIPMGVADPGVKEADVALKTRHQIPPDACVIAAFGGVTPEKRIEAVIRALSVAAERLPHVHVLLVGAGASHYDVQQDAERWGVGDRVHVTGFVSDAELSDYLAVADLCACLRWPTNRETSASWLRCIGAGRATLITQLAHQDDLVTLDPRGWQLLTSSRQRTEPVAVSIDPLDEAHSLQLALERLVADPELRRRLGGNARAWWEANHRLSMMADAYVRGLQQAVRLPAPSRAGLPAHLCDDGTRKVAQLAGAFGVGNPVDELL